MIKQNFEPGIYDISNDDYHASDGLSRSALWAFKQLPMKYWYEYLSGEYERPKETEAFLIGSMVHTMLLERHLFNEQYYMMPNCDRRTKGGKALYEDSLIEAGDRSVVHIDQFEQARNMVLSLESQDIVRNIVCKDAQIEKSIFWRDPETGILCKTRPDIWLDPLCGDLKTTDDASPRAFQASGMKYGYFLQAAMIYEALKSIQMPFEKFVFMCVEKKPPFAVGLYLLDDDALQYGLDLFRSLLRKFAECKIKNEWPDYGVNILTVPKYATVELINE